MLGRSCLRRYFAVNAFLPRVVDAKHPERMRLALIYAKERKKRLRYLGSKHQYQNHRVLQYIIEGGLRRGTRQILECAHTRRQFVHPTQMKNRYAVRTLPLSVGLLAPFGGFFLDRFNAERHCANTLQQGTFSKLLSEIDKQVGIDMLEAQGSRYVLLDEVAKVSVQNMRYHRHSIYARKFFWTPFPDTNPHIGDADYKWKGDELINYADYNAHTASPRNKFVSLWQRTAATPHAQAKSRATAAS